MELSGVERKPSTDKGEGLSLGKSLTGLCLIHHSWYQKQQPKYKINMKKYRSCPKVVR